jgi:5'-nucleotidase
MFKNGDSAKDTDSWALANNYISIVPVHTDLTAHKAISEIKKWKMDV